MLPPNVARTLAAMITLLALAGFIAVHVYAIYAAPLAVATPPAFKPNSTLTIVANGLTGLVSGVVAVGFGISSTGTGTAPITAHFRGVMRVIGLGGEPHDPVDRWRIRIAVAYVVVYVLMAIAALIAAIAMGPNVAEFTRTLAHVSIGMVVSVASSSLSRK